MEKTTFEVYYKVSHRHKDGGWGDMEEVPSHHSAPAHDKERMWGIGRLFRCTSCDEDVTLVPPGSGTEPHQEG